MLPLAWMSNLTVPTILYCLEMILLILKRGGLQNVDNVVKEVVTDDFGTVQQISSSVCSVVMIPPASLFRS